MLHITAVELTCHLWIVQASSVAPQLEAACLMQAGRQVRRGEGNLACKAEELRILSAGV